MLFNFGHPGGFDLALPCCGRSPGPWNGALDCPALSVVLASNMQKDFDTGRRNLYHSRVFGSLATLPREYKPPGPRLLKEMVPPV